MTGTRAKINCFTVYNVCRCFTYVNNNNNSSTSYMWSNQYIIIFVMIYSYIATVGMLSNDNNIGKSYFLRNFYLPSDHTYVLGVY